MTLHRLSLLTAALLALAVPPAFAASGSLNGTSDTLTITGTGTGETITVNQSGTELTVTASTGMNDPDGGGSECVASGDTATCADNAVDTIDVSGAGGDDTLKDNRGTHAGGDADSFSGGAGDDTLSNGASGFEGQLTFRGDADDDTITRGGGDETLVDGGT